MRFVTFASDHGPRAAAVRADGYVDLHEADPSLPTSLAEILGMGASAMDRVRRAIASGRAIPKAQVRLLAQIGRAHV